LSASPLPSAHIFQGASARRPAFGDHRLVGPDQFVEMIQDRAALDQHLAAVEHQRRHPAQRIERRQFFRVAEG
jgi:hypothetical protein